MTNDPRLDGYNAGVKSAMKACLECEKELLMRTDLTPKEIELGVTSVSNAFAKIKKLIVPNI